jgi:hypothetical protein
MGKIFTFLPPMPEGKKVRTKLIAPPTQGGFRSALLGILIFIIAAGACGTVWYMRGVERKKAADCAKKPVQTQVKKDCPKAEVKTPPAKTAVPAAKPQAPIKK